MLVATLHLHHAREPLIHGALEKCAPLRDDSTKSNTNTPNIDKQIYQILRDMVLSCRSDLQSNNDILQYLKDRGIKEHAQRKYHLGYCGPQYQQWFKKSVHTHRDLLTDAVLPSQEKQVNLLRSLPAFNVSICQSRKNYRLWWKKLK